MRNPLSAYFKAVVVKTISKGDAGKQDFTPNDALRHQVSPTKGTSTFRRFKTHCVTGILALLRSSYCQRLIGNPVAVVELEVL